MKLFDFPSRAAWTLLALAGLLAYGGLLALGIAIKPGPLLLPLLIVAASLAIGGFYTHARPDTRLAAMMSGTAFMIALGATEGVLTYPAAAIGGPLRDGMFVAFEHALHIDWPRLAEAMSANRWLNLVWGLAYLSSLPQIALAIVVLALADRGERLADYLSLLATTLLCVVLLSAAFPAHGPIPTYGIGGEALRRLGEGGKVFLPDYQALRAGTFTTFDLAHLNGIVTFPSFHCVLAVLTAWALAPVRWIGKPITALNALVILSTIPQGGHYVADIVAGCLIATLSLLMLRVGDSGRLPATTGRAAIIPAAK